MNIKHSLLIAVTSLSALTAANAQEKVEVKVTGPLRRCDLLAE